MDRGEPRLRPGISGRNSNASSRLSGNMSTLQEDLMKLIDPDYNLDSSFIVSIKNLNQIKLLLTQSFIVKNRIQIIQLIRISPEKMYQM
jgi:hypothetical protein